jgi:hypothetical protein
LLPPQRRPEASRRGISRFDAYTGAAPARPATRLRAGLAVFGLVFCGVAAGLFAVAGWPVPAALLCLVGATAVVDLVVLGTRARRRRRAKRRPAAMSAAAVARRRDHSDSYLP